MALTCRYYGIADVFYTWHRRYDTHGLCHGRWSAPAASPSLARMLGELGEPDRRHHRVQPSLPIDRLGSLSRSNRSAQLRMRSCGSELMVPRAPSSIANSLHR